MTDAPAPSAADRPALPSHALGYPPFRWYLATFLLSLIGTWMERITLGWYAWDSTQSPFWTGLVTAAILAPAGLIGPFAAVYAERWSLRPAAMILNSTLAGLSLAMFALVSFAGPPIWLVAALALAIGLVTALYHPVRLSMVARVLPRPLMAGGIGLHAATFNLSRILGPALAGVLLATLGIGPAFLANAVSYLPFVLAIALIPLQPRAGRRPEGPVALRRDLADGLRYLRHSPVLVWAIALAAVNGFVLRGAIENLPAVVGTVFGGDSTYLTLMTGLAGAGSVAASLLVARGRGGPLRLRRLIRLALPLGAVLVAVLGLSISPAVNLAVAVVAGFVATLIGIGTQSMVQIGVEDGYRARTVTWWSTTGFASLTLSGMLASTLGEWIPMGHVLVAIGCLGLPVSIRLALRAPAWSVSR